MLVLPSRVTLSSRRPPLPVYLALTSRSLSRHPPMRAYPPLKEERRIRVQTSCDDTSRLVTHNPLFDTRTIRTIDVNFFKLSLRVIIRRQRLMFAFFLSFPSFFLLFSLTKFCMRDLKLAVEFSSPCRREVAHTRDPCHIIPCFSLAGHISIDHPGPIVPSHSKEQCVS